MIKQNRQQIPDVNTETVFFLNPFNKAFLRGRVTEPGFVATRLQLIVEEILFFIVVAVCCVGFVYSANPFIAERFGVQVIGKFTDKRLIKTPRGITYSLAYQFNDGAWVYVHSLWVDQTIFETASLNTPVYFKYIPFFPNLCVLVDSKGNRITDTRAEAMLLLAAICGVVVTVNLIYSLLHFFRWRQSYHQMHHPDQVLHFVPGKIVECTAHDFYSNSVKYQIHILATFTNTSTGELTHVEARHIREDMKGKPLPLPGTPLIIAYFARPIDRGSHQGHMYIL